MDIGSQYEPQTTLAGELHAWNNQEEQFAKLFSPQALKDRDFLKLKLGQYDHLWNKYNRQPQTTDSRALLVMLQFQRRKLEKTLYPGLLRRLLHRVANGINGAIERRRLERQQQWQQPSYISPALPGRSDSYGQQPALNRERRQRWQNNLGQRQNGQRHNKKRGPHL